MAFNEVKGTAHAVQHLRRELILMFRQYFAEQEGLNGLRWVDDLNRATIFIAEKYPADVRDEDLRPAIIIERGPFRRQVLGLSDNLMAADLTRDTRTASSMISGRMIFHCLSRFGLEAEDIAWTVHDLIILYSDQLAARAGLHHVGETTVGAEAPYKPASSVTDEDQWADVPVMVDFFISRTVSWEHTPVRPLQQVALGSEG